MVDQSRQDKRGCGCHCFVSVAGTHPGKRPSKCLGLEQSIYRMDLVQSLSKRCVDSVSYLHLVPRYRLGKEEQLGWLNSQRKVKVGSP